MPAVDDSTGPVRVPKLTSRSGLLWVAGTGLALLAAAGFVAATQPENRWAVAVVVPLLGLGLLTLLSIRTTIDPATGTVCRSVLWVRRRSTPLATASSVKLVNNRAGTLALGVSGAGDRTTYLPVLTLTDYVERSQSPDFLRFLADQLGRWAPATTTGVVTRLRGQADAVEAGAAPAETPLAPLITRGITGVAKGGGAGGLLP